MTSGAPVPSLYVQTIAVVRGILPVLFAAAGVTALSGIVPDMPVLRILAFLAASLAGAMVAYAACLFVLSGGAVARGDAFAMARTGPGVLFVVAWIFPGLVMLLIETVAREAFRAGDGASAYMNLLGGCVFLILVARYGTVYPAIVDGADRSLDAAGERAPTGAVFWRILGASLFGVAIILGLLVFFFILDAVSPPGLGFVLSVATRMATFACMLSVFVAMVVVLCNAYGGAYGSRPV